MYLNKRDKTWLPKDLYTVTWADWADEPWLKGSGTFDDPYMIKNVVINAGGNFFCMMIMNSEAFFKITHCTFSNTGPYNSPDGRNAALILVNTQNGLIFKNNFISNDGAGVALIATLHNKIQKNIFSENGIGIYIEWGMYTIVKQNDIKNNFDSGIVIASAHKNLIEKNDITENGNAGIALINVGKPEHSPKDNIIYKNNIKNNQVGIFSDNADMNDILRNTIAENFYGIMFGDGSEGNTVYHNNILDNTVQVVDFQPSMNNWHHPYMEEGNFWADASYGYDEYPFVEKNGWEFMTPIEEEILDPLLPNRLGGNRIVSASQTSYIRYGVIQLFSERMNGEAYPPYTVRINGMEVTDSVWSFEEETDYGEPGLKQLYYIKFPPYFLTEELELDFGYHEYLVEISWYNSGELQVVSFITGFTLILYGLYDHFFFIFKRKRILLFQVDRITSNH